MSAAFLKSRERERVMMHGEGILDMVFKLH